MYPSINNSSSVLHLLYDCDVSYLTEEGRKIFPCYYGGPILLNINNDFDKFQFLNNAGKKIGPEIQLHEAKAALTIYVFPNCDICILNPTGNLYFYHPNGIIYNIIDVTDNTPIVCFSESFLGLIFARQSGNVYFLDAQLQQITYTYKLDEDSLPRRIALYSSQPFEFIFADRTNSIIHVKGNTFLKLRECNASVEAIYTYPGGLYVAAISKSNLWIVPISKSTKSPMNELNLPLGTNFFAWSSSSTFLFGNKNLLTLISEEALLKPIEMINLIGIVSDEGCARFITSGGVYLLLEKYDELNQIANPSKELLELYKAFQKYKNEDFECFKIVDNLKTQLPNLTHSILDSVQYLLDKEIQHIFLEVAAFALDQSFSDRYHLEETIQKLQLFNYANSQEVGHALSPKMKDNNYDNLLSRLETATEYNAAMTIASSFYLDTAKVAERWAIDRTAAGFPLSETVNLLTKFEGVSLLSVADGLTGRLSPRELRLLAFNISDPLSRVNFLLEKAPAEAESAAVSSGDGAAMLAVLLRAPRGDGQARKELEAQRDNILCFSPSPARPPKGLRALEARILFDGSFDPAEAGGKLSGVIQDHRQLARMAKGAQSPREALERAIAAGQEKSARRIAERFRFSEEAVLRVRLRALVRAAMWDELDSLTRAEPVCGWAIVSRECAAVGDIARAKRFARMIVDADERERCVRSLECLEG